jgi:hypothetical protein
MTHALMKALDTFNTVLNYTTCPGPVDLGVKYLLADNLDVTAIEVSRKENWDPPSMSCPLETPPIDQSPPWNHAEP